MAADHAVQLYATPAELASPVCAYLASGFDLDEPAIVVATPAHWRLFSERLAACGWPEADLRARGLLEYHDADQVLASICDEGKLSPRLFDQVVGGLISDLGDRFPGRQVRVFGEMVDLLCERGKPEVAAELENLWNHLAQRKRFSLLCGYRVDLFDPESQRSLLPQVCGAHTHVRPAADIEKLGVAVEGALREELGGAAAEVYARMDPTIGRSRWLPASERALLWVSVNMPAQADRILSAARARYASAR